MNLSDDFSQGILLHLYLDYWWDFYALRSYIENFKDNNWFQPYRNEIGLASAWLFHHTDWGTKVWDEMTECPMSAYENGHGIVKQDVANFINRNNKWHIENDIGPSTAFTPDYVEEFTSKVAINFKNWLQERVD